MVTGSVIVVHHASGAMRFHGYATHKTPAIRQWFARHPRWHLHFAPTGASWLNQVECFFALLTEKQIRRGIHRSTQELGDAILAYIDAANEEPKPFKWTKSVDDILAAIKRFCLTTIQAAEAKTKSCELLNQDTSLDPRQSVCQIRDSGSRMKNPLRN